MNNEVKKGDIFFADLSPSVGSEQSGTRPVLIVQNNIGNKFSPTVIAAAITSHHKNDLPMSRFKKGFGSAARTDKNS